MICLILFLFKEIHNNNHKSRSRSTAEILLLKFYIEIPLNIVTIPLCSQHRLMIKIEFLFENDFFLTK